MILKPMKGPSNKGKRIASYVALGFSILFGVSLITFSSFPGDLSAKQSNFVSYILSGVINSVATPSYRTMVEPTGLNLLSDSSLLEKKDGVSQMAEGTTTMLVFGVDSPFLGKDEYLNPSFVCNIPEKDEGKVQIFLSESGSRKTVWIETHSLGHYDLEFVAGKDKKVDYSFDVIPLPKPDDASYKDIPETLNVGESYRFDFEMEDPKVKSHDNFYYHRYFSPEMTSFVSDDTSVCRFEKNVLYALKEGKTNIHIGSLTYPLTIEAKGEDVTIEDGYELTRSGSYLAKNDCDYFTPTDGVYSGVKFVSPCDSYFYIVDQDGKKISESEYNLNARIWQIDSKAAYVLGYREAKELFVKAESRSLDSSYKPHSSKIEKVEYNEILPISMELSINGEKASDSVMSGMQGKTYYIKGDFLGEGNNSNVTNKKLQVLNLAENVYSVAGQGTESLSITFKKEGNYQIEIASLADDSLRKTLDFEVTLRPVADPTDSDFLSFIRKLIGHGTLFALYAISTFLFFYLYSDEKWGLFGFLASSVALVFLAFLTEGIQCLVPDRDGNLTDVGIDSLGGFIGIAIVYLVVLVVLLIKKLRKKNKKD